MADSKRRIRYEHSAGGVVLDEVDGALRVAMIATRGRTRWGLPKGAVSKGETPEQAAVREVQEETGLEARSIRLLDTIEYFFRAGDGLIRKQVDFFLMDYLAGEIRPQLSEVDDAVWFEIDEGIRLASFESERKLLVEAKESWKG
ncbi:MAG: NUDIX hydrolase [Thermoanaerobaculia bacterium]